MNLRVRRLRLAHSVPTLPMKCKKRCCAYLPSPDHNFTLLYVASSRQLPLKHLSLMEVVVILLNRRVILHFKATWFLQSVADNLCRSLCYLDSRPETTRRKPNSSQCWRLLLSCIVFVFVGLKPEAWLYSSHYNNSFFFQFRIRAYTILYEKVYIPYSIK